MGLRGWAVLGCALALLGCDDSSSGGESTFVDARISAPYDAAGAGDSAVDAPDADQAEADGDVDAGADLTPDAAAPMADAAAPMADAAVPMADAAVPMVDAAVPMPDAAVPMPDAAPVDWPADRPAGQCKRGGDCPSGDCTLSAPGGFCGGAFAGCPAGAENNGFGTCSRPCGDDAECPVGLICRAGPNGDYCALARCADPGECEQPYTCTDGFCRRPSCDEGCPAPLACAGNWCVEP